MGFEISSEISLEISSEISLEINSEISSVASDIAVNKNQIAFWQEQIAELEEWYNSEARYGVPIAVRVAVTNKIGYCRERVKENEEQIARKLRDD